MRQVVWIAALLCGAVLLLAPITPAQAQATRTWVSGVGDDANPCSRTAPCKTFAGAISKTAARGEISVLDPGGFGAVTITKSISIVNDYSGEAGILASGTNGITVNAAATDVVLLRGLVIDGGTPAIPGLNGIRFLAGAALHVDKCLIKNFTANSAGVANGILFAPSGASELYVTESYIANNGTGSIGGGIMVRPTGTGGAKVTIDRTSVVNNISGVTADTGSGPTSSAAFVTVHNTTVSGHTLTGFAAISGAATGVAFLAIDRSVSVNNATGLSTSGASALMNVGQTTIIGSTTGISGANIRSFGNNELINNSVNGSFTPPLIALQ